MCSMPLYTMRSLQPEDAQAVFDLHTRAITEVCAKHYSPEAITAWVGGRTPEGYLRNQSRGENFHVAVNATGTPIGFCGWRNNEVCGLYVNPDYHGQGVGTALLKAAETAAQASGTPLTQLEATITAQGFYEKHGYTKTGTGTTLRNGTEIPHITMQKLPTNFEAENS